MVGPGEISNSELEEVLVSNGDGALLKHLQTLRIFEGPGKKFSLDAGAQVSGLCVDVGDKGISCLCKSRF